MATDLEKKAVKGQAIATVEVFEKLEEGLQFEKVRASKVEFFRQGRSFVVLGLTDDVATRAIVDNEVIPMIKDNNGSLVATYNGIYTSDTTGNKYPQFNIGIAL